MGFNKDEVSRNENQLKEDNLAEQLPKSKKMAGLRDSIWAVKIIFTAESLRSNIT